MKYKYIQMELEDVETDFDTYLNEFNSFFSKFQKKEEKEPVMGVSGSNEGVTEYWVNQETGEVRNEEPDTSESPKPKIQIEKKADTKYKKLFKNISIKAHPDRGGTNEDFYTLKAAYDSDNLIGMIDLAVKYDIDYEIDSEDEVLLRKNIINYEDKIKDMQKSLAWVWATSKSKKEKLDVIKTIEQQIGCKIPLNEIEDKL